MIWRSSRLVRPVGDVVLDLVAALVDRVGALAEAEEALAGRGAEADAGRRHPGRRIDRHRHMEHPLPVRLDADVQPPAGRVVRGGDEYQRLSLAGGGGDARRVVPAGGRLEAERAERGRPGAGELPEAAVAGDAAKLQRPGVGRERRGQLAALDRLVGGRRRGRAHRHHRHRAEPGADPPESHALKVVALPRFGDG